MIEDRVLVRSVRNVMPDGTTLARTETACVQLRWLGKEPAQITNGAASYYGEWRLLPREPEGQVE